MGLNMKTPSCSWVGSTRVTIIIGILPVATSAASDYIRLPPTVNAMPIESYYTNCNYTTGLECDSENQTFAHNGTNDTLSDPSRNEPLSDLILMGVLSVVLGLMILVTVIGNVFVIAAILLERNLQNVANYLIVSLAVADLMVACLVMPLGAVYAIGWGWIFHNFLFVNFCRMTITTNVLTSDYWLFLMYETFIKAHIKISNNWIMGPELCDMWTSIDVLCCTASILHLVAIAVDRYWAVTNVDYIHTRNSHRIGIMIVVVWSIALVVSLAPQIPQFKDPEYMHRINVKKQCLVSQDVKYQIFATSSTFYVPLLVIFVLYWKIFQTARKRIRRRREMKGQVILKVEKTNNNSRVSKNFFTKRKFLKLKKCSSSSKKSSAAEALVSSIIMTEGQSTTGTMEIVEEQDEVQTNGKQEETTAFTITKPQTSTGNPLISNNVSPEKSSSATTNNGSASHQSHISDISRVEILNKEIPTCPASVDKLLPSKREKKESLEAKRERKAAKTLAIITGAFVMCWLPFFILALLMPLCGDACTISDYITTFALWLGYFNSTLNPVIYTIFNPEFRQAFKRILCGGHSRGRNFRSGKIR